MLIYYFRTRSLPTSFKWLHSIPLYGYIVIYLTSILLGGTWIIDNIFAPTNFTP